MALPRPATHHVAAGLSYDVLGHGPALLLVHGLGSARSVWQPVRAALAERFTTIAVDLPGHGASPLPTEPAAARRTLRARRTAAPAAASPRDLAGQVGAFLDALGLDQVDVVGHSLGGWVALELAADGRARTLTALAPAGLWLVPFRSRGGVVRLNRALAVGTSPLHDRLLRRRWARVVGMATSSALPHHLPVQVALDAAEAMTSSTGFTALHAGTLRRRFERGRQVTVPLTVVFGDADRILPASRCQYKALVPPHTRWTVLPRCGHVPPWDRPEDTLRIVAETVARGDRAAGP